MNISKIITNLLSKFTPNVLQTIKQNFSMSTVTVNGVTYNGNSVSMSGNKIIVDGKDVTPDAKIINITVDGDIDSVSLDYCQKMIVNGSVKNVKTSSGDVDCKEVTGSVSSMSGDITCENVGGDVQTMSGDVKCGNISGNVRTVSGDIKNKSNNRI